MVSAGVWQAPWASGGRRGTVAGPLGLVWLPWGRCRPLGFVWPPWWRGWIPGPRMAAVVAWPATWASCGYLGAWPNPWTPCGCREGVAGHLGQGAGHAPVAATLIVETHTEKSSRCMLADMLGPVICTQHSTFRFTPSVTVTRSGGTFPTTIAVE